MDARALAMGGLLLGTGFAACVPGFASRHDILGTGGSASTGTSASTGAGGHGGTGGVAAPTCHDGIKNGEDETGVDCGGKTCPACPLGQGCATIADCAGASAADAGATPLVQCLEGVCVPPALGRWEKVAAGPPARVDASMTYDAFNGQTTLVAGTDWTTSKALLDTWIWDGIQWFQVQPLPLLSGSRYGALFVDEPPMARALVFGGCGISLNLPVSKGDVIEWDGLVWTPLTPPATPDPRCYMATAYDAARDRVVLFGGQNEVPAFFGDAWEWNGATWHQPASATTPPTSRSRAGAAYDAARGVTVMFGGFRHDTIDTRFDETWTWDGSQWTQPQPGAHPSHRSDLAMAYDARRRRTVLFGGKDSQSPAGQQDTWEWDGAQWTEMPIPAASAPGPRAGHSMTFDSVRGRVVMFGGGADTAAWEYVAGASACASSASCDDTFTCVDGLCCEQPSCDVCHGCNVLGSAGKCSPLPAGAKDPGCATACDGMGACQ